ncbi:MAG: hypothetical protein ABI743_00380 [bacterium]
MPSLTRTLTGFSIALCGLLALSCQQGHAPTIPHEPSAADGSVTWRPELVQSEGANAAGVEALGIYDLAIDAATGEVQLTATRSGAALADAYLLDLTSAFTTSQFGCPDCLQATGVDRSTVGADTIVAVTFNVRHPFPTPLATGRKDLHINNVRLAILAAGSESFYGDVNDAPVAGDVSLVPNADGYVSLPPGFISASGVSNTLFPFVVFQTGDNLNTPTGNFSAANGWTDNILTPTGYNVFPMGGNADTTVNFRFTAPGSTQLHGRIALLGNYIVSAANRTQRPTPTYFMPDGAMSEAWHVEVDAPPAPFSASIGTEVANVTVRVADWQHGGSIDPTFPDPANPTGLRASSDVLRVNVDIPGFNLGSFGPLTTPTSGTGTLADPLVYPVLVTKPAGTVAGDYLALAKVVDSRSDQNALKNDLATVVTLTGLSTYQVCTVVVAQPNVPPTCGGYTVNPNPPSNIPYNSNVTLSFDFSNDDGTITNVEADWGYDGVTFTPDANRATPGDLVHAFTAAATIAIRFTDNDSLQNDPALCTTPVTVQPPSFLGPKQPLPPYGGLNVSRIDAVNNRPPLATYGDNIYVLVRDGLMGIGSGQTFVIRSADLGQTWGNPYNIQPGTQWFANSIATMANGKVMVACMKSTPGDRSPKITRLTNSGANDVALDSVNNMIVSGWGDFGNFDLTCVTDPTDPNIAYVGMTDNLTNGRWKLRRISNANAAPTFDYASTGTGTMFDIGVCCVLIDGQIAIDGSGDVHGIIKVSGSPFTISYREFLKATGNWRTVAETLPTAGYNTQELYLAVGFNDNLPIVAYAGNGLAGNDDAYFMKATNSGAPTFGTASPALVSDVVTGAQIRPMIDVDNATGNIYITFGDSRDPAESSSSRYAGFLSRFGPSGTRLFSDLKIDDPGTADNSGGTGDFINVITNRGTPSARKIFLFWRDSDEVVPASDVYYRIGGPLT